MSRVVKVAPDTCACSQPFVIEHYRKLIAMLPINSHILMVPAVLLRGKPWPMAAVHGSTGDYGGSIMMLGGVSPRRSLADYWVFHSPWDMAVGSLLQGWRPIGKAGDLYGKFAERSDADGLEPRFGEAFTSIYVMGMPRGRTRVYVRTAPIVGQVRHGKYRLFVEEGESWHYVGLVDEPAFPYASRL